MANPVRDGVARFQVVSAVRSTFIDVFVNCDHSVAVVDGVFRLDFEIPDRLPGNRVHKKSRDAIGILPAIPACIDSVQPGGGFHTSGLSTCSGALQRFCDPPQHSPNFLLAEVFGGFAVQ